MEEEKKFFVLLELGKDDYGKTQYWVEDRLDPLTYQENLNSVLSEEYILDYGFVKIAYTFYQDYGLAKNRDLDILAIAVARMSRLFGLYNVESRPYQSRTCWGGSIIEYIMRLLISCDEFEEDQKPEPEKSEDSCPFCHNLLTDEEKQEDYYIPVLNLRRSTPGDEGRVYYYETCCKKCCDDGDIDDRQWTTQGYIEVNPRTNEPRYSCSESRERERVKKSLLEIKNWKP